MNKIGSIIFLSLWLALFANQSTAQAPYVAKDGNCQKLFVDGKPFLLIAGELHNSNASSIEYMAPLMKRLNTMHLNSVLAPITWEQFEPEEGKFDYTLIDGLIREAKTNDLKLVVIWFATWKNGQSSYAPLWVKKDTERFKRVVTKSGDLIETLSPFCDETRNADAKAFAALMKRIKEVDQDHTVIMMQPENEVGILGHDFDYGTEALDALESEVPRALMNYMEVHQETLRSELDSVWSEQGRPANGNWKEVFGDTPQAREFLLAWQMSSFMDFVAAAGKEQYDIPMFVNAWLVQEPDDLPGVYPNGGPVSRVMDIYKAAGPSLFTMCPDIYLPNFKEICADYTRDDNPLLIPESTVDPGRAFYAFAEHNAICYSPFAIEKRAYKNSAYLTAYAALNELHDTIVAHQGKGTMRGLLREGDETLQEFDMGSYHVKTFFENQNAPCYGLIIQESEHQFLVAGVNLRMQFSSLDESQTGYIGYVEELVRDEDDWRVLRVLNGDETYHHSSLRVFGRESTIGTTHSDLITGPQPTANDPVVATGMHAPGVYRVTTYMRAK